MNVQMIKTMLGIATGGCNDKKPSEALKTPAGCVQSDGKVEWGAGASTQRGGQEKSPIKGRRKRTIRGRQFI